LRSSLRFILLLVGIGLPTAAAQDKPIAFTGATIIPIAGSPIENGALVVHQGKITAVGVSSAVSIPAHAQRIDMTGKVIIPGLVDTHSHIYNNRRPDMTTER